MDGIRVSLRQYLPHCLVNIHQKGWVNPQKGMGIATSLQSVLTPFHPALYSLLISFLIRFSSLRSAIFLSAVHFFPLRIIPHIVASCCSHIPNVLIFSLLSRPATTMTTLSDTLYCIYISVIAAHPKGARLNADLHTSSLAHTDDSEQSQHFLFIIHRSLLIQYMTA